MKIARRLCNVEQTPETKQKKNREREWKSNLQKIRYSRERIENMPINCRRNYELRGCWNTNVAAETWFQMRLRTFEQENEFLEPMNTMWVHVRPALISILTPQRQGNRRKPPKTPEERWITPIGYSIILMRRSFHVAPELVEPWDQLYRIKNYFKRLNRKKPDSCIQIQDP